jgi:hypothetical protein
VKEPFEAEQHARVIVVGAPSLDQEVADLVPLLV